METVPGLTWFTLVFEREITLWLGKLEVRIAHPGAGHTKGDTVVWLSSQKVLFSGDLVEYDAACYCSDAHSRNGRAGDARSLAQSVEAQKLVPGRGPALLNPADVDRADYTRNFVTTLLQAGKDAVAQKLDLKSAMALARQSVDGPEVRSRFHLRALSAVRRVARL